MLLKIGASIMFPDPNHLPYICKLTCQTLGIPVFHLLDAEIIGFDYAQEIVLNPLRASRTEFLGQHYDQLLRQPCPIIFTTEYEEIYIIIPVQYANGTSTLLVIGPSLDSQPTEIGLRSLLSDVRIPASKHEAFVRYYETLPVVPLIDSVHASMQLFYMLYREPVDLADIYTLSYSMRSETFRVENLEQRLIQGRLTAVLHHDPLIETMIMQAIKEGNRDKVVQYSRELSKHGQFGLLSRTSFLRSKKNLAIAGITLATRAAMEGGLDYETALTISDIYIQSVEELRDSQAISQFLEKSLAEFADQVNLKKRRRYSKPINGCLYFIHKHLYEEISLSDLAVSVSLHPYYLSSLFRKEVGRTLGEYIRDTKIEEAAKLLRLTDQSITEISAALHFHDQSYFTKTFKKVMGTTPKQYRRNPHLTFPPPSQSAASQPQP
jgi:AraC-like DNA-binding protein